MKPHKIELKFCEVSSNSFSISAFYAKKVLFLKKYDLDHCQYHNKKALFTDPVFSEGFAGDLAHFDDTLL